MSEMNLPDKGPERGSYHSELPDYAEENQVGSGTSGAGREGSELLRWIARGVLLLMLILLTPPLYHAAKEWRSDMLLGEAEKAFSIGDNAMAIGLLKQSLALSPGSLSVQHAVELYNARSGDQPSMNKLLDRMRSRKSDPGELLGIAELEIASVHPEVVKEALGALPSKLNDEQSLRRTLAEASLMAQGGDFTKAAETCLSRTSSFSTASAFRLKVQAALYLLAANSDEGPRNAVALLMQVMKNNGKISLTAWRLLAKIVLTPSQGSTGLLSPDEISLLIKSLDKLPGHTFLDSLTAADLEIVQDPTGKQKVVERLKSTCLLTSRSEMLEFARWMNARGFQKDIIEVAGSERPLKDTDWLLIVLDAETLLGNWKEVARMLDSPAGAGIPDAVRHLFLARVALMNNDQNRAEDEWRNVGQALHLEKAETLAYIARYEEQIEAYERAARTYREMADREGATKIPGLIGLIRCQSRNAPAVQLIPMYEELVATAPSMADAQGDLAYLKLLANEDIPEAAAIAQKLLSDQPDNLSRISVAALGRLRSGDPKGALLLYREKIINWPAAPEPWKVVRVAVLRGNGDLHAAEALLSSINTSSLRPEEGELIYAKAN